MYNAAMLVESGHFIETLRAQEFRRFLGGKRVGKDIDGTEVFSQEKSVEEFNLRYRNYKNQKTVGDLDIAFAMDNWLREYHGENAPVESRIHWNRGAVLLNARPVDGAVELSRSVSSYGNDELRITSRPSRTAEWTYAYYNFWMPWVPKKDIRIQKDGNDIDHRFKVHTIGEEKIDYFYEDNPDHALDIVTNTDAIVTMVVWPWNINSTPRHPRIIRPWVDYPDGYELKQGSIYTAHIALAHYLEFL